VVKIKSNEKGFGTLEAILIVIILVLIGVVGYMVYKNHHKSTPVASVSNTQATVKPDSSTSSTATTKTTLASTTTVVQIPELGIQITVPNSIKDLVYATNTATLNNGNSATYAKFSTTSLSNTDSGCSDSFGPLGSLERANGTYPAEDNSAPEEYGQLVKQFLTFYISSGSPQAACSQNTTTDTVAQTDKGLFFNSFSTITQISN